MKTFILAIPVLLGITFAVAADPKVDETELKNAIKAELIARHYGSLYNESWKFTKRAEVVKIHNVSVDESNQYKLRVRCKVTDMEKNLYVTVYLDIYIEKLVPDDPDSWRITSTDYLKTIRRVE